MDIQTTQTFSDSPQSRPPEVSPVTPKNTPPQTPQINGFQIPKNPKVLLLLILATVVLLLLVVALLVPKKRPTTPQATPTPIFTPAPNPSQANNIDLPPELKSAFTQIDSDLAAPLIPANPPEIDLKVGSN